MKLKVSEVLAAYEAFARLTREKLPAKGAYWVARLVKKLEPEYQAATERRTALIRELGEEKDGTIQVPQAKMKDFLEQLQPVLETEIEVDAPRMKLEHLGDTVLLAGDVLAIEKFIEE